MTFSLQLSLQNHTCFASKQAFASVAEEATPSDWRCYFDEVEADKSKDDRQLSYNSLATHHHPDQDDRVQDHHHDHHHGVGIQQVLSHIKDKLPAGSNAHLGQRRTLQQGGYIFEVGLYIEYDTQLPSFVGGGEAGVVNYVNKIVTGANIIFEVRNSFIVLLLYF